MTDVERFFRRLVSNLAATDPARLRRPVPLDEISREILPYRANRRALQLDTSEDYELVLLRLCAGEGGMVRIEPDEARARFAQEIRSANPDLDVLHAFENVQLTLKAESLARALEAEPEGSYALPSRRAEPEIDPELVLGAAQFDDLPGLSDAELPEVDALRETPDAEELPDADELPETAEASAAEPALSCLYCGGSLPVHRPVNFCPHCGQSQTQILCPECRSEIEPGWRHCVNCGAAVGEG
ncbi:MAG TPA: zinc ribbon domain-containing protein [Gemmatimonadales bacterium]|nr:zinc ribbon domain-containing protein [Gemmatimonadales bacterium]